MFFHTDSDVKNNSNGDFFIYDIFKFDEKMSDLNFSTCCSAEEWMIVVEITCGYSSIAKICNVKFDFFVF